MRGFRFGADVPSYGSAAAWDTDTWTLPSSHTSFPSRYQHHEPVEVNENRLLPEGARVRCAVPGCDGQIKFWKRNGRPVFEGHWTCDKKCGNRVVELFVRRQIASESQAEQAVTHTHRIPLGLMLLDRGAITQEQLWKALTAQRDAGHGRIGEWLQRICEVSDKSITRAVAAQWNRPVLSDAAFAPEVMASVMPEMLRHAWKLLPLRIAGGKILYAAFEDHVNASALAAVEHMTGLRVESGLMEQGKLAAAVSRLKGMTPVACHNIRVNGVHEISEAVVNALWKEQPLASRLVCVHGVWWLRMWLERGAIGRYGLLPASTEDVRDVVLHS